MACLRIWLWGHAGGYTLTCAAPTAINVEMHVILLAYPASILDYPFECFAGVNFILFEDDLPVLCAHRAIKF